MARRVFFSFHYKQDIWRVSQVRNSWRTRGGDTQTFLDAADWESIKKRGERSVTDWIDKQLSGTSVTVVLIGEHTSERPFVRYEIQESHRRGNGLLGIFIHKLKGQRGDQSYKGLNPFTHMTTTVEESSWLGWVTEKKRKRLSALYPVYDWVDDKGYDNLVGWIEETAQKAGR
jgi:hypothetical protein